MRLLRRVRDLWRGHPTLLLYTALNRVPFRPVRIAYYDRLELRVLPPARSGSPPPIPTRAADVGDLERLVRCQDKRETFERRFREGEHCLIAVVDDAVVGFEWFSSKSTQIEERYGYTIEIPEDALYAYDAYTSEAFRNRGVWRQIILAASDLMKREGRNRLISHIDLGNEISVAAHVKVGFRLVGRYVDGYLLGIRFHRQVWDGSRV